MDDQTPQLPDDRQPVLTPLLRFPNNFLRSREFLQYHLQFSSLVLIFILYQVVGGGITLLLFKAEITQENVGAFRWATLVGQILFILLPTIVLARLRYPGVRGFFQVKVPDYKEVVLSVIAVFALQQLLQGYMMMQDAIPLPGPVQQLFDVFKKVLEETYKLLVTAHSPGEFIFVVLVVAFTPAMCEELFFRGLIQHSFEEGSVGLRGALLTGMIFAAYHINPFTFIPLFALGAYFGFLVYRSRNLTVAMSAHFFNNFVACAAVYMQLKDDFVAVAPGGNVTQLDLLMNFGLFGVVFVAATYYFIRVTDPATDTSGRGG